MNTHTSYIPADKLFRFRNHACVNAPAIPMHLSDYLELIEWSGRVVRSDKRGAIDLRAPAIIERLGIDPAVRQDAMRVRSNVFGRALGQLDRLRLHAQATGQRHIRGLSQAQRLFRRA